MKNTEIESRFNSKLVRDRLQISLLILREFEPIN